MKLHSRKHEYRMIKTLCSDHIKPDWLIATIGKTNESYFHFEPTRAAFTRIRNIVSKSQTLPNWDDLVADPILSEDFRDDLIESKAKPYKKLKNLEGSWDTLEKYRRIREVYFTCKDTIESIASEDSVDVDEMLSTMGNRLAKAHANTSEFSDYTLTFGEDDADAYKFAKHVLDSPAEVMYKTGFDHHDAINGGLPSSGVMLLASTTSGGKSVTAMNLGYNMWMLNDVDVCRVSLEMMKEQELKRFMSRVSGVPFWKIKQNKLSEREKKTILRQLKSVNSNPRHKDEWLGKKKFKTKRKLTTITPDSSLTMEGLLNMLKPFGFHITFIDYVGLLEGMDGERQWQMLGDACRHAKNYSKVTGSLVVILCQFNGDTDQLKYSQAMKDHADVLWSWAYNKPEIRETKQLPVNVGKARDGELISFYLDEAFEFMRVTSPKGAATSRDAAQHTTDDVDDSGERSVE